MSDKELTKIETALKAALSGDEVNQLGRDTKQSVRLRTITPYRLFLAIVAALAGREVESIADLQREFNHQNDTTTAYKAFYNRLARAGFAEFMYQMVCRLLGMLALRTLHADASGALAAFEDIVIQDGSSFALKHTLKAAFPGRFTATEPAAVELHATYSGYLDNPISVTLAPDCDAERPFLPAAADLRDKLLLGDRGYPAIPYFVDLVAHAASFIMRLTRTFDPYVVGVCRKGTVQPLRQPVRLAQFLSQYQGCALDLDVEFKCGKLRHRFRLVVLPGKDKWRTRLCTNLDRERFPLALVGKLYRFRWQIELCFKEWKSYANLHCFDTGNAHIAEGLIWASLCASLLKRFLAHAAQLVGGQPMSTRRVAMCARHVIDALFAALQCHPAELAAVLGDGLRYLLANAQRAHPRRDHATGRLRAGLLVEGVA